MLYRLAVWRVKEKLEEMTTYLNPSNRVLDVGAGNSVLCQQLRQRGYDITPLDLENHSFVKDIVPVIYDGSTFPFNDDSFDVALLITVLHHCPNPDAILVEAKRVAKKVIVVEETYESVFEKYMTYAIDSLFNFEFFNHPHTNRTDGGWRKAFQDIGLDVNTPVYSRSLQFLRRVTYVLTRRVV
jgi:ubiquinone/menaquinone biosynthesis C-methylase UbiE